MARPAPTIAYVSDQVLPRVATDTEQTLNMVAAFGDAGAKVKLVVPAPRRREDASAEALARHYGVSPSFELVPAGRSVAGIRTVEKSVAATHGVRVADALEPDILYSRNLPVVVSALLQTRRRVVFETYRPWPDQKRWLRWLLRGVARAQDRLRLVLHSELAARAYRSVGFRPDHILVAHNGFNPEHLSPRLSAREARAHCGLPPDGFIATYVGSVAPRKGLDTLLDLAVALPELHFVIVGSRGEGPIEARARGLANVTVAPWRPAATIAPFLYASDVLLIPPTLGPLRTVGDTVLPIKTFQYMAAGRAILGPDGPDLREVLEHDRSALLVTPDDHQAALRGLRRLRDDAQLRQRLGDTARASAEARAWDRRAARILEFLSTTWGRVDAPAGDR